MHPLNEYISKQVADKLRSRKVVVWYDPHCEFARYIAEMRGSVRTSNEAVPVTVGGLSARLAHIGVIDSLTEAGIEPDVVCGTSIGVLAARPMSRASSARCGSGRRRRPGARSCG